jgi:RNA polymerase-binding transcription factor DksA
MDVVDHANEIAEQDLARRIANATRPRQRGPEACDCGEPISELRRNIGAERCIDCQTAHEHQARSRAK